MADFIECFIKNPTGEDTLVEVVKLYEQAEKNVHAAAKAKHGDEGYMAGGDDFGEAMHALLMELLANVDLMDDAIYQDLVDKAEKWYVPLDDDNPDLAPKCGVVSAPLIAAVKDAKAQQERNQLELLREICLKCESEPVIKQCISLLSNEELSASERMLQVRHLMINNKASLFFSNNIPRDVLSKLIVAASLPDLFANPIVMYLQEKKSQKITDEAYSLYKQAFAAAVNYGKPGDTDAAKKKAKELLLKRFINMLHGEETDKLGEGLSAWNFPDDKKTKKYCEIVKEVMHQAIFECSHENDCDKLMNACLDYRSDLVPVAENEKSKKYVKVAANQQIEVVNKLINSLGEQYLPSERLQKFNELYRDSNNQKILGKSNDDAATKFRKIVDTILALFQKDTKQKLSSIWAKPVDSLKDIAGKAAEYYPFGKKK
ncbi:MAG TPA: hypothetical protein VL360_07170 [Gammaproteobacteria bacterium]|nr:hypothetical protein [Gammaproteobacteria bacterium]